MSARLKLDPLVVPLRETSPGAYRVGKCRVLFELVIEAFREGESPEGIVNRYQTLDLSDVYAVLAYYLKNKEEVEAYLRWCDEEADRVRKELETLRPPIPDLKEKLMERWGRLQEERRAAAAP